ncbi:MAG: YjiH family protein [Oscillibacter sp.]|jgi:nucleoside recognition membrane protein YjiH|nr:YjiH family protein [Oscillibacter sp.]
METSQTEDLRTNQPLDPDMPSEDLDKIKLTKKQLIRGLLLLIIGGSLGIFCFFGKIPVNGESTVVFSLLYNGFTGLFGVFVYWIVAILICGNLVLHVYYVYVKKKTAKSRLAETYENDNFVLTVLYVLGAFYSVEYALYMTLPGFTGVVAVTGDATGGSVFPPIVVGVLGIILVGAVCMPFLLNYGVLEIVGTLLEPLMRPLFKIPGKAALDCTTSFVTSSSMGVLITNRLYRMQVYTEKEMCTIMTGFSAVSIGFAYLVISTAGCGDNFTKIYIVSFVMVFLMAPIMVRIFPLNRKKDTFVTGREQTPEERKADAHYSAKTLPVGFSRSVKRAAISRGPVQDIWLSLKDGAVILPKVLTMLAAIGLSAMILANYTPIFTWIGYVFRPLISLLRIPDAAEIAASMPIGICEMFLPVLIIQGKAASLAVEARIFVCLVSMCQIIFFSETGTVMLACKSPIKFWELLVCFLERTLLAMVIAAAAIHLLF